MKRMLVLSFLLTGILSCSKSENYEGRAILPGKWRLTGHGICGIAGCSYTRYTGPEISLTLYADNRFNPISDSYVKSR